MFSGNALHGVLPAVTRTGVADTDEPRVTLIVAWWDGSAGPRDNPGGHGPLQTTPDPRRGWQATDLPAVSGSECDSYDVDEECMEMVLGVPDEPCGIPGSVDMVEPLWERVVVANRVEGVKGGDAACEAVDDGRSLPPLRYFLQSEDTLERIYEQAAVEVYWERELSAGRM